MFKMLRQQKKYSEHGNNFGCFQILIIVVKMRETSRSESMFFRILIGANKNKVKQGIMYL